MLEYDNISMITHRNFEKYDKTVGYRKIKSYTQIHCMKYTEQKLLKSWDYFSRIIIV